MIKDSLTNNRADRCVGDPSSLAPAFSRRLAVWRANDVYWVVCRTHIDGTYARAGEMCAASVAGVGGKKKAVAKEKR